MNSSALWGADTVDGEASTARPLPATDRGAGPAVDSAGERDSCAAGCSAAGADAAGGAAGSVLAVFCAHPANVTSRIEIATSESRVGLDDLRVRTNGAPSLRDFRGLDETTLSVRTSR
jgi:hypothetical protein